MNTHVGAIPQSVGFPTRMNEGGEVRRAITRKHTKQDQGKKFIDNFGRSYTYTEHGYIY